MRRTPTKPGFQAAAAPAPLVDAPPCANPRKDGYCYACASCKVRVCGSEWWLFPRQLIEGRMLEASLLNAQAERELFNGAASPLLVTNGAAP